MKKNKLLLIGGGSALLLLAILFGALFTSPLLASARSSQTNANAASTPAAATPTPNPYCQRYFQDLAKRLGVPVSTLQRDMLAAADRTLAQPFKKRQVTHKQANSTKQVLPSHPRYPRTQPSQRRILQQ